MKMKNIFLISTLYHWWFLQNVISFSIIPYIFEIEGKVRQNSEIRIIFQKYRKSILLIQPLSFFLTFVEKGFLTKKFNKISYNLEKRFHFKNYENFTIVTNRIEDEQLGKFLKIFS